MGFEIVKMGTTYFKHHIILILVFLTFINCSKEDSSDSNSSTEQNENQKESGLKDKAENFYIGVATNANRLNSEADYDPLIRREFSSITAEYEMKMQPILRQRGNYNWTKADQIVDYATEHGINVHGHALVWHNATPEWLENFSGTDTEFEEEVKNYIKTVVGRYKGKVSSWDVVNEGVSDQGGSLRNTVFLRRMGEDYMAKCFQYAREADPNALLFYNDYNMTSNSSKQDKVFELINDWKQRQIPIDGVGYQMHISYLHPSKAQIQLATNRAVDNNLLLHFSEIDVRSNPNKDITELTDIRAEQQKTKYKEVVKIFNAIPDKNKYALTLWGIKDDDSWLLSHHNNDNEWPLLFDKNFMAKKAYQGFSEGLE